MGRGLTQGTGQQGAGEGSPPAAGRNRSSTPPPSPFPASSQPAGPPAPSTSSLRRKQGALARAWECHAPHRCTEPALPLPGTAGPGLPLPQHSHRFLLSDSLLQPFLEIPKNNKAGSSSHMCLHFVSSQPLPGPLPRCPFVPLLQAVARFMALGPLPAPRPSCGCSPSLPPTTGGEQRSCPRPPQHRNGLPQGFGVRQLLGLVGDPTCWRSPRTLPATPSSPQPLCRVGPSCPPSQGEPGHRGVPAGGGRGSGRGHALSPLPAQGQESCAGEAAGSLPPNRRGQGEHSVGSQCLRGPTGSTSAPLPQPTASAQGGAQHSRGPGAQTGSASGTHGCGTRDLQPSSTRAGSGPRGTGKCMTDQHRLGMLTRSDLLQLQLPPPSALALGHQATRPSHEAKSCSDTWW